MDAKYVFGGQNYFSVSEYGIKVKIGFTCLINLGFLIYFLKGTFYKKLFLNRL